MPTEVDPQITACLGPYRAEMVERVLAYTSWFRCPFCGQYGNAEHEAAGTVLYTEMGMAGGYSSDYTCDGFRPDEPTLVRWWLTRRHPGCAGSPVQPWSAVPAAAAMVSWRDPGPPDRWWTPILPVGAGLPVLVWQQSVPTVHVRCSRDHDGLGPEVLIDVLPHVMLERGADRLTAKHLPLDAADSARRVDGWYGHLVPDATTLTVWVRAGYVEWLDLHAAGRDPQTARRVLGTVTRLPPAWVTTVAAQRQALLIVVPPGTLNPAVTDEEVWSHPALHAAVQRGTAVGGLVHCGTAPDEQRHTAPPPAQPGRPRAPAAPSIDVSALWTAAAARAATITATYPPTRPYLGPQVTVAPEDLIALVLVALSRQHDLDPATVGLIDVVRHLAWSHPLPPYLDTMLAPTSLAGRCRATLAVAYANRPGEPSLTTPLDVLSDMARTGVEQQRLADLGDVRFGDRVRIIPPPHLPDLAAPIATVTGIMSSTWFHPGGYADTYGTTIGDLFVVRRRDDILDGSAFGVDLLLDDADPRATRHAAASVTFHLQGTMGDLNASEYRRSQSLQALRSRIRHYTVPAVRNILTSLDTTLEETPPGDYPTVLHTAIDALQALIRHPNGDT